MEHSPRNPDLPDPHVGPDAAGLAGVTRLDDPCRVVGARGRARSDAQCGLGGPARSEQRVRQARTRDARTLPVRVESRLGRGGERRADGRSGNPPADPRLLLRLCDDSLSRRKDRQCARPCIRYGGAHGRRGRAGRFRMARSGRWSVRPRRCFGCSARSARWRPPMPLSSCTANRAPARSSVPRQSTNTRRRRREPFVAINCGAISPQLLLSELFGYERGAFTGREPAQDRADRGRQRRHAVSRRDRRSPDGRTGEPAALSSRRACRPPRRFRSDSVDVRVISATHFDLDAAMDEGRFRADLYHPALRAAHRQPAAARARQGYRSARAACARTLQERCVAAVARVFR